MDRFIVRFVDRYGRTRALILDAESRKKAEEEVLRLYANSVLSSELILETERTWKLLGGK